MSISAPELSSSEATDADCHAHNLRKWQQRYDQLSNGQFFGRIDELALENAQVFVEHTSQALHQHCVVWPDAVWLGFAAGAQACRIDGLEVTPDQVMVRPGSYDFELITPAGFDIYGVVVSQTALLRVAEIQGLTLDERAWLQPRKSSRPEPLAALRGMLPHFLAPTQVGASAHLQQELLLTTAIEVLQQQAADTGVKSSFARRKAVVDRVQAYLEANSQTPVTITELCELTHVSRRTLQYSFESILGINPARYLRTVRLNNVRRVLSRQTTDDTTISAIAAEWGFWHLGQFAHDYKQLFGENPSMTLARGREG
ncbi:MAG: helix-turn-helix domain-containing protein [Marinobacter sp.]|nr:helix-turn-helix domain-containing protein [Marinobacter sp.]